MIAIDLNLNGNDVWPELAERDVIEVTDGMLGLAVLPHGMNSGEAAIVLRIDLPSGHVVITQTSWRLLSTAAKAIAAQYGWMGGMG